MTGSSAHARRRSAKNEALCREYSGRQVRREQAQELYAALQAIEIPFQKKLSHAADVELKILAEILGLDRGREMFE